MPPVAGDTDPTRVPSPALQGLIHLLGTYSGCSQIRASDPSVQAQGLSRALRLVYTFLRS